jgi:hypothetical protein
MPISTSVWRRLKAAGTLRWLPTKAPRS